MSKKKFCQKKFCQIEIYIKFFFSINLVKKFAKKKNFPKKNLFKNKFIGKDHVEDIVCKKKKDIYHDYIMIPCQLKRKQIKYMFY